MIKLFSRRSAKQQASCTDSAREMPGPYYDRAKVQARVDKGRHRDVVGGLWEELGQLQIEFLRQNGLLPSHKVLDIGCGSLRAGVKLVSYLHRDHYWGVNINESLLSAGYEKEIAAMGLSDRLSRSNLICNGDFNFSAISIHINYALAQSVFTHLPLNYFRHCLLKLRRVISPDGRLFSTFFICPDDVPIELPYKHRVGGVVTRDISDPYHCRADDVRYLAENAGWKLEWLGDWNHPRDQKMAILSPS